MAVRPEDYAEVVARINRKYDGDIRRGDQFENPSRIPTGSLELDAAMGGGIPVGRWSRFYGGYHSSKTLNALHVIREAQNMGLLCAYYNVEKQLDGEFAEEKIGVDAKGLTVVEGTSIEEIGEKMEAFFNVCHVHVIDSCSIAVSEDELNADVRDWRPGIAARAWGKVFKRLNERFDSVDNTVIMIDQVRVNFRTGGEDPPGGRILDHQSSMTVHFKKGSWLHRDAEGNLSEKGTQEKGSSGQMEPAGIEIKARVEKSRVCRPFRTATMRFDLDTLTFDRDYEYIKAAKHYGVVKTHGAYFHIVNEDGEVLEKLHGDKNLRRYITENPDFKESIRDTVVAAANR